jgi:hypothetical protein
MMWIATVWGKMVEEEERAFPDVGAGRVGLEGEGASSTRLRMATMATFPVARVMTGVSGGDKARPAHCDNNASSNLAVPNQLRAEPETLNEHRQTVCGTSHTPYYIELCSDRGNGVVDEGCCCSPNSGGRSEPVKLLVQGKERDFREDEEYAWAMGGFKPKIPSTVAIIAPIAVLVRFAS